MKKILFVNAINPLSEVQYRWPNLGLGYLASSVRLRFKKEFDIRIIDRTVKEEISSWSPDIVGITSVSQNYNYAKQYAAWAKAAGAFVIIGGMHISSLPGTMTPDMDVAVIGEGERVICDLLELHLDGKPVPRTMQADALIDPIDQITRPARDLLHIRVQSSLFSSRGCPYRCLSGDTIIHTMDGDFPIRELVGKSDVKVLTRDPLNQQPIYALAKNISKTQENAELVRVQFDDGSHIDCTPDHKFKVFKSRNQYINESEWDVEARDLKPKQQIRAVRFEVQKTGRKVVSTRRDVNRYHADIVLESLIGRALSTSEIAHHRDKNPGNDHPSNLILTDKSNHSSHHPEVAERMRRDNPVWKMTPEQRSKSGAACRGKKRTLEQRLRYRESKLGEKNPMFRPDAKHIYAPSRIREVVNHKVVSVERLPTRQDVYCMEIPGIHWFYANKVLVHNCTFCFSSRYWRKVRFFSAEYVAEELIEMARMGVRRANFYDDLFVADKKRLVKLAEIIRNEPALSKMRFWCNCRANTVTDETAEILAAMGVVSVGMGLESGNARTLEYLKGGSVSVEDNYNAVRILHKHGIAATASFVIGSPDETEAEIMDTYRFIQRSGLDFVDAFPLIPFPCTPVWDEAMARGLVSENMDWNRLNVYWTRKDDPIVMSRHLSRADLDRIYAKFQRLRLLIAFKRAWFHPFFKEMVKAGVKKSINSVRMLCQKSA